MAKNTTVDTLAAEIPELLSTARYFDYAYNWADDDGTMTDDDIVEIRVSGKALKDLHALVGRLIGVDPHA